VGPARQRRVIERTKDAAGLLQNFAVVLQNFALLQNFAVAPNDHVVDVVVVLSSSWMNNNNKQITMHCKTLQ